MKISWTEAAISHLRAAYDYVAADNPAAAEEVLRRTNHPMHVREQIRAQQTLVGSINGDAERTW